MDKIAWVKNKNESIMIKSLTEACRTQEPFAFAKLAIRPVHLLSYCPMVRGLFCREFTLQVISLFDVKHDRYLVVSWAKRHEKGVFEVCTQGKLKKVLAEND